MACTETLISPNKDNVDDPAPVGCDVAEGNAQNIRNICPDDSGVLGYQDLHEGYRLYIAYGNCNCPSDRSPYDQVNC